MSSSKALDSEIATKLMGLTIKNPKDIPAYSSDIYAAHKVINRLQMLGWSCFVRSNINREGVLYYKAHFHLGRKLHSERDAPTIPMAVCMAALAIANEQYVEFVEEGEDKPMEISEPLSELGLREIEIRDEPITDLLARALKKRDLPFKDKEGKRQTFHRLFFKLVMGGFMTRDEQDILPPTLVSFFLDILKKNNYLIVKKVDSDPE